MTLERAFTIHNACSAAYFRYLGFASEGGDISGLSLAEMVEAAAITRKHGTIAHPDGTQTVTAICDDRLLAALYVTENYPASEPDSAEPIITLGHKAVVVVHLPEEKNDGQT